MLVFFPWLVTVRKDLLFLLIKLGCCELENNNDKSYLILAGLEVLSIKLKLFSVTTEISYSN